MTLSLLQMQLGMGDTLKVAVVGFVIVLVVLAFIAVLIKIISAIFSKLLGGEKKPAVKVEASAPSAPAAPVAAAPAIAPAVPGYLHLEGVTEANAAVIMALVSHQTGIPLERLAFHSIKCMQPTVELIDVDEPTAAAIMAIVSDTTGVPLERLDFTSIRLIKEN